MSSIARWLLGAAVLAGGAGCGDDSASGGSSAGGQPAGGGEPEGGAGGAGDGGAGGSGGAAVVDKAALCDDTFGEALTASFGRLDGTVLAVVLPSDTQCALVNDDHVVIEVTMDGATYRAVVNIQSDFGDPDVRFLALDEALPGGWSQGWHPGVPFDYVSDLGLHAGPPFEPIPMDELAQRIADEITIGQKVAIFSDSSGGASSHKIHRNGGGKDGAIVLDAGGPSPRWLLFHFANQQF